jgi:hypothetical protein
METDLSYVSKTILNVLPDSIDLSKEIKYSSYVQRRDYTEIYPTTQPPAAITSSNLGTSVRIVLADPARWLDKRSACLMMDIGGIVAQNPTDVGNFAVLDGPCAMLSRVNIFVGGQQINGGTINTINKVACVNQFNNGSIASYLSDEASMTGGCEKLRYALSIGGVPTTGSVYNTLTNSPFNLLPTKVVPPAGSTLKDAQGFLTSKGLYSPGVAGNDGGPLYGYNSSNYVNNAVQTVSIPLSVLSDFFNHSEMLPLFLCKEVVIELFFASPIVTFCSDVTTVGTGGGVAGVSSPLASYTVTNLKVVCDLVTCAPELDDMYKLKAASSEGLIIPYDDYAMSSKTVAWSSGASVVHQCPLTTNNLKSAIVFRQAQMVESQQNGWSNSGYLYNGITGYVSNVNNTNIPANPLNSLQAMLTFNMRCRASIGNQLSNCIANNRFIFGAAETIPTAPAAVAGDIAPICGFMIYNNYQKINDEEIDVGNGLSLASAGSMLNIKYMEDIGGVGSPAALRAAALLGPSNSYNLYVLMQYGKALIMSEGTIQIKG